MNSVSRHWRMLAFLTLAVTGVLLFVLTTLTQDATPEKPRDETSQSQQSIPNCKYEDGSDSPNPCYWDGGPNGKGERYIIWNDNVYTQSDYLER